jgi:hypothetical protein
MKLRHAQHAFDIHIGNEDVPRFQASDLTRIGRASAPANPPESQSPAGFRQSSRPAGFLTVPLPSRLRDGLFSPTSANGFGSAVFISIR